MYLYFFEGGGGGLSIFLSKDMGVAYTRGAAYTSEYGIMLCFKFLYEYVYVYTFVYVQILVHLNVNRCTTLYKNVHT